VEVIGKEKYTQYIQLLQQYLSKQLEKNEYDKNLKELLVEETQLKLHNLFVLSILRSACTPSGTNVQGETNNIQETDQPMTKKKVDRTTLDWENTKSYMSFKSKQFNLELDDESVDLMQMALEQHLQSIFNTLKVSKRELPIPLGGELEEMIDNNKVILETNRTNLIDQVEVQIGIENHPELFQGNFSNLLEKTNLNNFM